MCSFKIVFCTEQDENKVSSMIHSTKLYGNKQQGIGYYNYFYSECFTIRIGWNSGVIEIYYRI